MVQISELGVGFGFQNLGFHAWGLELRIRDASRRKTRFHVETLQIDKLGSMKFANFISNSKANV